MEIRDIRGGFRGLCRMPVFFMPFMPFMVNLSFAFPMPPVFPVVNAFGFCLCQAPLFSVFSVYSVVNALPLTLCPPSPSRWI